MVNWKQKLAEIASQNEGLLTYSLLKKYEVPHNVFLRLVREEAYVKLARGVYGVPGSRLDGYKVLQLHVSDSIYCHSTALLLHGLTDEVLPEMELCVPQGYNASNLRGKAKVHFVKKTFLSLGSVTVKDFHGYQIAVYDREKTLCDIVKSRGLVTDAMFREAWKRYAALPDRDFDKIRYYAALLHIEKDVNTLLMVL